MIDVCIVSYVTREWEVYADGTIREIVAGPGFFVAMTLRSLGLDVAMVTKVSKDDIEILRDLYNKGVRIFNTFTHRTMKSRLIYRSLSEREIEVLSRADPFNMEDVSICVSNRARVTYLGPLTTDDIDIHLISYLSNYTHLYIDVQGFTRKLLVDKIAYVDWKDKLVASRYVHALKLDDREGYLLTGFRDPKKIIEILRSYGYRRIVLTTNEGVYISIEDDICFAPYKVEKVVGRTGRGDTAMAAFIYADLHSFDLETMTKFVAAATSMKLSMVGPLTASIDDVFNYMKKHYG